MSKNIPLVESGEPDDISPGYLGPTPPIGPIPQRGERLWVDRPEQLLQAVKLLTTSSVVAIDAEFTQPRSSRHGGSSVPRLSLLQLAIQKHCFVVDTLRLGDLSPLEAVVANPNIMVLLHGAGADIRVMAERGLHVSQFYDLEATSRSIFGQRESSLASMLQRAFNYRLDKSLQRTDWTRRPLPSAMIAYAARDAEVTLALYYWLDQHYHDILQLHKNNGQRPLAASWIEPFLRGSSPLAPEMAVEEALAEGILSSKTQIETDCRAALQTLTHPMLRSRLLRLIADLSLAPLVPDLLLLLHASTSDERAGSIRALGRLGVKSAHEALQSLLQDPVYDVRKAASIALRNLAQAPRQHRAPSAIAPDGSRSWSTEPSEQDDNNNTGGWKSRLRSLMDA
ncbi:MAG: hypothetical protein J2P36_03300 [Ktedonobacteraceae bacterium]|nr:hypothetical protein [Ktedonobacteraceae bacterium]